MHVISFGILPQKYNEDMPADRRFPLASQIYLYIYDVYYQSGGKRDSLRSQAS